MRRKACLMGICALLVSPGAQAAQSELSADEQLTATQGELKKAEADAAEISAQRSRIEGELKNLQGDLVGISRTVQKNEHGLLDAEEKIAILDRDVKQKGEELAGQQEKLDAMMQAAVSLSHTPPEAAMMLPEEFGRSVKAARVLKSLADAIRQQSAEITQQLAELNAMKQRVQKGRQKIGEDQERLKVEQAQLDDKLSERRRLSDQLLKEQEQVKTRMRELSRQSKDLRELLAGLEKTRREKEAQEAKEAAEKAKQEKTARKKEKPKEKGETRGRSFVRAKGKLRLPAAGRATSRFGQALGQNETSKGITLKARANARVVAPYDGEVVFTGPFLTYGNMVILRHTDDYYTLLAGMETINVSPGQFLLEGEPIGAMSGAASGAELYIELRQHNQPIDPAPWLEGV